MKNLRHRFVPLAAGLFFAGAPAAAVTMFSETEANDTQQTANHIAVHDGSIDVFGFQKSDFDWFSFHGTAGDTLTLEVQDEGAAPGYDYGFDSVMALHNDLFELAWDDDDEGNLDANGFDLPQRVRDEFGSYIEYTLSQSGIYYVRLENFGITDEETYNYRLVVRGLTPTQSGAAGVVPLPAGLPLLLTVIGMMGGARLLRRS